MIFREIGQARIEQLIDALIGAVKLGIVLDRVGDFERVARDRLLVFAFVVRGEIDGAGDRILHPRREPLLDAEVERDGCEDGNEDHRHHGDHREDADEPRLQTRAGDARAPLDPETREPPRDERAERQHDREVGEQEPDQCGAGRLIGNKTGDDGVGRNAGERPPERPTPNAASDDREAPRSALRNAGRTDCLRTRHPGPLLAR